MPTRLKIKIILNIIIYRYLFDMYIILNLSKETICSNVNALNFPK